MSWAGKRQAAYISGVIIFIFVVIGIPVFLWLYEKPNCFDGIQNQDELGVDIGGPCNLLHESQVQEAVVLWARSFEVLPGVYSTVSYIDNPNFDAGVKNVRYWFKLFDAQNILVAERRGNTFLSPNGLTPVFEGGITTSERVPTRVFFEFIEELKWEFVENPVKGLSIGNRELQREDSSPVLKAVVENKSFEDILDTEITVTLFDSNGNAVGASRTVIDVLKKQSSETIVFTWPQPFGTPISKIEIIPRAPFR